MSRGINEDSHPAARTSDITKKDRWAGLPDELLLQLFDIIGRMSKRDLCAISRLNRRYHKLSDAVLYKSISFSSPDLHLTFSESLRRRPRRGSAIHEIKLSYPSSELSELALNVPVPGSHYEASKTRPSRVDGLSRTLSVMSNLETLDIAVPVTLAHGIGTLFNGPFDLTCLKSCSLFYQCTGDEYWDLRENVHIFAHPTLEKLTIKRAKFDSRGFDLLERPHETALKTLHLVECDFSDDALSDVAEFPLGLEEFVMTQKSDPEPKLEESSDDLYDYIVALESQGHSLTSITIDYPTMGSRRALSMRDFAAVHTLRLNWDYQLYGNSSAKSRVQSVGLPPNLVTLEFFSPLGTDSEVTEMLMYTIRKKLLIASTWQNMIVVASDDDEGHGISQDLITVCKEQRLHLKIIGGLDYEDTADRPDMHGRKTSVGQEIDFRHIMVSQRARSSTY